jgi:hypothetical protein
VVSLPVEKQFVAVIVANPENGMAWSEETRIAVKKPPFASAPKKIHIVAFRTYQSEMPKASGLMCAVLASVGAPSPLNHCC